MRRRGQLWLGGGGLRLRGALGGGSRRTFRSGGRRRAAVGRRCAARREQRTGGLAKSRAARVRSLALLGDLRGARDDPPGVCVIDRTAHAPAEGRRPHRVRHRPAGRRTTRRPPGRPAWLSGPVRDSAQLSCRDCCPHRQSFGGLPCVGAHGIFTTPEQRSGVRRL